MKTGIERIAEERKQQLHKHGYTKAHDVREHSDGALITAALYALTMNKKYEQAGFDDFESAIFEKYEQKRMIDALAVAGALIAAEIDRLQNSNL